MISYKVLKIDLNIYPQTYEIVNFHGKALMIGAWYERLCCHAFCYTITSLAVTRMVYKKRLTKSQPRHPVMVEGHAQFIHYKKKFQTTPKRTTKSLYGVFGAAKYV